MPGVPQQGSRPPSQIFIELQPQEAFSSGISTYRSRDISAP